MPTSEENLRIVRPPRWGVAVITFLVLVSFVPPVLSSTLPAWVRVVAFLIGFAILARVTQLRLIVTDTELTAVNFFRTVSYRLADLELPEKQPSVGSLVVRTPTGVELSLAATPVGGEARDRIERELRSRISAAKA